MKIKRLTAALAVAAMAAGFTLASPMLSAQAAVVSNIVGQDITATPPGSPYVYDGGTADGSTGAAPIKQIDVLQNLLDVANGTSTTPATALGVGQWIVTGDIEPISGILGGAFFYKVDSWDCNKNGFQIVDATTLKPFTDGLNHGTATCDPAVPGGIRYQPAPMMGINAQVTVAIKFQLDANVSAATQALMTGNSDTYQPISLVSYVKVLVIKPTATGCDGSTAVNFNATLQAYGPGDDASTATFNTIKGNVASPSNPNGAIANPEDPTNWGLQAFDTASSTDIYLSNLISYMSRSPKDRNTLVFTAPAKWSGNITYYYTIAKYDDPTATPPTFDQTTYQYGCIFLTVQPTLSAPDLIVSDPGAPVTIPLLGQGSLPIIGTKNFQNASCVFASNGKSKDPLVGSIVSKGGSKNPVFTPNDDFTGPVDLTCTVEDALGTVSNEVTVSIQVGAVPAPAPVVPATPSCDKTDSNGKCILSVTGGSLAAPMSSGLAAVVLLVAAGAGILVVRRRTSLAG